MRYGAGVDEEESDDDDVIGPVLPTSQVKEKTAAEEFMEREERMKRSQEVSLRSSRTLSFILPPLSSNHLFQSRQDSLQDVEPIVYRCR